MTSEENHWITTLREFLSHIQAEASHAVEGFTLFADTVESLIRDTGELGDNPDETLAMKYQEARRLESVFDGMGSLNDFHWSKKAEQAKEELYRALRDVLRVYWRELGNPSHDPADFPEIPAGTEVRLVEGRTLFLGRDEAALRVSRATAARIWTVLEPHPPDISGMPLLLLLGSDNLRQLARWEAVELVAPAPKPAVGKTRKPRPAPQWRIPLSEVRPLMVIPGIGRSMAEDLHDLGFRQMADLRDRDPQEMYDRLRIMRGGKMDRCVLYAFRCAVYFASHEKHDPELLKWWNWKDRD